VKRKFIILAVVLLTVSIGAASWWYVRVRAAAVEFPSDVLALLPSDVSVIAYVDMAALRDQPLVQRLASMALPVTPGTDYANFVAATGFDYQRDLDRVVLASSSASAMQTPPAHTLVIADGRFDQKKIEDYALRDGKKEIRNGHTVYTTPTATPGKTTAFTFLSAGRLALADGGDISSVLGQSPQATADAGLQEQITRVAGAPIFMVAKPKAIVPTGAARGSTPLDNLRWVNIAARPDGDKVVLSAEGACDSPEQAKQIAATLELLRGISRGMLVDPKNTGNMPPETVKAISQMIQAAQISTDASRVRLLIGVDSATFGAATPTPKQ
jgi:hypothetical protein